MYWMREFADGRFTPVWRIIVGLSLIPAFGTLYQRLTLQESTRFKKSQEAELPEQGDLEKEKMGAAVGVHATESESDVVEELPSVSKKAHFRGMVLRGVECLPRSHNFLEVIKYFSEWRHLKILIGTCSCWFLLDVAYVRCRSSNRFLSDVVVLVSMGST